MASVAQKVKTAAITKAIQSALNYLEKDPEKNIPKLMDLVDRLVPEDWYTGQRNAIRDAIERKTNYYDMILKMYTLDEGVRKTFIAYTDNSPCEVSIKMYDDDRHEILNETDKDQVWADMLEFLEGCIA